MVKIAQMNSTAYFQLDERTEEKLEFYDGEVYALAGGSLQHGILCGNIFAELRSALTKGETACQAFNSEVRIQIEAVNAYVYPDTSIACPPLKTVAEPAEAITNPILIVEVLSPSTESYDRGGKFHRYRQLDTLQEYVLIDSQSYTVETYRRQPAHESDLQRGGIITSACYGRPPKSPAKPASVKAPPPTAHLR